VLPADQPYVSWLPGQMIVERPMLLASTEVSILPTYMTTSAASTADVAAVKPDELSELMAVPSTYITSDQVL